SSGSSTLPHDHHGLITNRVGDAGRLTTTIDEATTTRLLRDALPAHRLQIDDLLLTALALALARWRASRDPANPTAPIVIDVEGHGREDVVGPIDLSRTVGWFTTIFPVRLDLGGVDIAAAAAGGSAAGLALKRIKEERRAIPHNGLSFGLL